MNPLSLLELSRTSKRFRKTVMSRSSRFIWKRVLAQIHGLPKCPDDLTEPQYAYLAFDPYCDVRFHILSWYKYRLFDLAVLRSSCYRNLLGLPYQMLSWLYDGTVRSLSGFSVHNTTESLPYSFHSFVIEGFETEPYRYERYVPCINNLQGGLTSCGASPCLTHQRNREGISPKRHRRVQR